MFDMYQDYSCSVSHYLNLGQKSACQELARCTCIFKTLLEIIPRTKDKSSCCVFGKMFKAYSKIMTWLVVWIQYVSHFTNCILWKIFHSSTPNFLVWNLLIHMTELSWWSGSYCFHWCIHTKGRLVMIIRLMWKQSSFICILVYHTYLVRWHFETGMFYTFTMWRCHKYLNSCILNLTYKNLTS